MALPLLRSFLPTADDLLRQDLATLGGALLAHLKSFEDILHNSVYQHGGADFRCFEVRGISLLSGHAWV
jgi:hypothetical protein